MFERERESWILYKPVFCSQQKSKVRKEQKLLRKKETKKEKKMSATFVIQLEGKLVKSKLKRVHVTVQKLLVLCQTCSSVDQVEAAINEGIGANEHEYEVMRTLVDVIRGKWVNEFGFHNNTRSADIDPTNYDVCFSELMKRQQRGKLTRDVRGIMDGFERALCILKQQQLRVTDTTKELYNERARALACMADSRPYHDNLEELGTWLDDCQQAIDAFEFVLAITESERNLATIEQWANVPRPASPLW